MRWQDNGLWVGQNDGVERRKCVRTGDIWGRRILRRALFNLIFFTISHGANATKACASFVLESDWMDEQYLC